MPTTEFLRRYENVEKTARLLTFGHSGHRYRTMTFDERQVLREIQCMLRDVVRAAPTSTSGQRVWPATKETE